LVVEMGNLPIDQYSAEDTIVVESNLIAAYKYFIIKLRILTIDFVDFNHNQVD
jgi:hypothetical protein